MIVAHVLFGWSLVNPLVQFLPAMMPAVAAVIVRRWVTREGFADAGLQLRLRAAWRLYLPALLGPVLTAGSIVDTAMLFGWYEWDPSAVGDSLGGIPILVAVPLLSPVFWGEEFGWTGYLRPRLLPSRPFVSVLVAAFIWAVWHYSRASPDTPSSTTSRSGCSAGPRSSFRCRRS